MKKLGVVKLNKLSAASMSTAEMKQIKGGNSCTCGCCYSGSGGSGSIDNGFANCSSNKRTGCSGGFTMNC